MNEQSAIPASLTRKERLMGAITRRPVDRPPVWLMRQAGRYMPEYQAVKKEYTFTEMCTIPSVAADVSLQPYDALGVDCVIVFNDILIPFNHMGLTVEFTDRGPAVSPPVRSAEDAARVREGRFDETPPVFESIREIRRRVGFDTPVFGFAGAPFTMAVYMVEGQMSKNLRYIKTLMYENPDRLRALLDVIAPTVIEYLKIQIRAGADVVQIFDTWAGALSEGEYRTFALPYQQLIIREIQENAGTPVVLYLKDSSPFLGEMRESGAAVLSVDWRLDLWTVNERLGGGCVLQGNLDPTALYAPPERVQSLVNGILRRHDVSTGHIFNLGHGILPETPVESVKTLVDTVKAHACKRDAPGD